jgi:glycosyltransferase involved in cell wall biosynthesis
MGGPYDVVIPARNEDMTIGGIIDSFHRARNIGKVIVVDDASIDNTWSEAVIHGAMVVKGYGVGKGQAVKIGLEFVSTETVALCDADLTGFDTNAAETLLDDFQLATDTDVMIMGVPEFTPNLPWAHNADPSTWAMLTGERRVPLELIKELDLHGYAMEVQINAAAQMAGLPVIRRSLTGVKGLVKPGFYEQRVKDYYRDLKWLLDNGVGA